jgi:hypothetical protein
MTWCAGPARHERGPRRWVTWLLAAAILLKGTAAFAETEAFRFSEDGWQGTSQLLGLARERLGKDRVKVVANIPWDDLAPEDGLLVLHPERELHYRELAAFLGAGGRVGLLDDFGRGDVTLGKFRIHRVQPPIRPREALAGNPNLAMAFSASDGTAHPIVAGVERLVTNHPTALRTEEGVTLTPVLHIPAIGESDRLLAVIGVIGDARACGLSDDGPLMSGDRRGRCGRLFAMGDPSAVINLMLRYPGNRAFAAGLVDYLVADDTWGKRGGRLFIAANAFGQRGTFGGAAGLEPSFGDRMHALEDLVADIHRDGLPRPLTMLLAAVLTLFGVWFIGRGTTRPYARPTPRYARPTPLVLQGGVAGRAAALSAPSTHPALAVLELKSALEVSLRQGFSMDAHASTDQIRAAARERPGLDAGWRRSLEGLLAEMQAAEDAVATSRRIRVTPEAVARMKRTMTDLLRTLDRSRGRS